jgi:hypothetical protein
VSYDHNPSQRDPDFKWISEFTKLWSLDWNVGFATRSLFRNKFYFPSDPFKQFLHIIRGKELMNEIPETVNYSDLEIELMMPRDFDEIPLAKVSLHVAGTISLPNVAIASSSSSDGNKTTKNVYGSEEEWDGDAFMIRHLVKLSVNQHQGKQLPGHTTTNLKRALDLVALCRRELGNLPRELKVRDSMATFTEAVGTSNAFSSTLTIPIVHQLESTVEVSVSGGSLDDALMIVVRRLAEESVAAEKSTSMMAIQFEIKKDPNVLSSGSSLTFSTNDLRTKKEQFVASVKAAIVEGDTVLLNFTLAVKRQLPEQLVGRENVAPHFIEDKSVKPEPPKKEKSLHEKLRGSRFKSINWLTAGFVEVKRAYKLTYVDSVKKLPRCFHRLPFETIATHAFFHSNDVIAFRKLYSSFAKSKMKTATARNAMIDELLEKLSVEIVRLIDRGEISTASLVLMQMLSIVTPYRVSPTYAMKQCKSFVSGVCGLLHSIRGMVSCLSATAVELSLKLSHLDYDESARLEQQDNQFSSAQTLGTKRAQAFSKKQAQEESARESLNKSKYLYQHFWDALSELKICLTRLLVAARNSSDLKSVKALLLTKVSMLNPPRRKSKAITAETLLKSRESLKAARRGLQQLSNDLSDIGSTLFMVHASISSDLLMELLQQDASSYDVVIPVKSGFLSSIFGSSSADADVSPLDDDDGQKKASAALKFETGYVDWALIRAQRDANVKKGSFLPSSSTKAAAEEKKGSKTIHEPPVTFTELLGFVWARARGKAVWKSLTLDPLTRECAHRKFAVSMAHQSETRNMQKNAVGADKQQKRLALMTETLPEENLLAREVVDGRLEPVWASIWTLHSLLGNHWKGRQGAVAVRANYEEELFRGQASYSVAFDMVKIRYLSETGLQPLLKDAYLHIGTMPEMLNPYVEISCNLLSGSSLLQLWRLNSQDCLRLLTGQTSLMHGTQAGTTAAEALRAGTGVPTRADVTFPPTLHGAARAMAIRPAERRRLKNPFSGSLYGARGVLEGLGDAREICLRAWVHPPILENPPMSSAQLQTLLRTGYGSDGSPPSSMGLDVRSIRLSVYCGFSALTLRQWGRPHFHRQSAMSEKLIHMDSTPVDKDKAAQEALLAFQDPDFGRQSWGGHKCRQEVVVRVDCPKVANADKERQAVFFSRRLFAAQTIKSLQFLADSDDWLPLSLVTGARKFGPEAFERLAESQVLAQVTEALAQAGECLVEALSVQPESLYGPGADTRRLSLNDLVVILGDGFVTSQDVALSGGNGDSEHDSSKPDEPVVVETARVVASSATRSKIAQVQEKKKVAAGVPLAYSPCQIAFTLLAVQQKSTNYLGGNTGDVTDADYNHYPDPRLAHLGLLDRRRLKGMRLQIGRDDQLARLISCTVWFSDAACRSVWALAGTDEGLDNCLRYESYSAWLAFKRCLRSGHVLAAYDSAWTTIALSPEAAESAGSVLSAQTGNEGETKTRSASVSASAGAGADGTAAEPPPPSPPPPPMVNFKSHGPMLLRMDCSLARKAHAVGTAVQLMLAVLRCENQRSVRRPTALVQVLARHICLGSRLVVLSPQSVHLRGGCGQLLLLLEQVENAFELGRLRLLSCHSFPSAALPAYKSTNREADAVERAYRLDPVPVAAARAAPLQGNGGDDAEDATRAVTVSEAIAADTAATLSLRLGNARFRASASAMLQQLQQMLQVLSELLAGDVHANCLLAVHNEGASMQQLIDSYPDIQSCRGTTATRASASRQQEPNRRRLGGRASELLDFMDDQEQPAVSLGVGDSRLSTPETHRSQRSQRSQSGNLHGNTNGNGNAKPPRSDPRQQTLSSGRKESDPNPDIPIPGSASTSMGMQPSGSNVSLLTTLSLQDEESGGGHPDPGGSDPGPGANCSPSSSSQGYSGSRSQVAGMSKLKLALKSKLRGVGSRLGAVVDDEEDEEAEAKPHIFDQFEPFVRDKARAPRTPAESLSLVEYQRKLGVAIQGKK